MARVEKKTTAETTSYIHGRQGKGSWHCATCSQTLVYSFNSNTSRQVQGTGELPQRFYSKPRSLRAKLEGQDVMV